MRHASCGNGGAMEREESQKQAFLSFHSSLEISPPTRDSHISTAPATRPVFVEQRKTARRIYLGGWESGNPEAGFPLSHRPDQPAAQGKNHFEKQLKTKAVYTKLLTPPCSRPSSTLHPFVERLVGTLGETCSTLWRSELVALFCLSLLRWPYVQTCTKAVNSGGQTGRAGSTFLPRVVVRANPCKGYVSLVR